MINRKLDNALRQTVSDALRNLNYPCYHSSLNVAYEKYTKNIRKER